MTIEDNKRSYLIYFGKNLEKIRTEKGLSYRQLAQRCDVDFSEISKIEKGERNIQITTIVELAKGLNKSPKDLFDFKTEEI
ncbi:MULTISPECIES: helix-turn-helix domain-containing protein [Empedobacter]|uniref:XRE family transcriptional regulator n=1 Tax=Empedobacter tilapiae TaxID=2491114 RepID=A0A4Z1BK91_9FLAO|nr:MULTISPECIES: helix-turn-helix transcriptional regulator [Empedobacter]MDH1883695.1 helix-turn-helix domain-containing protein [Empedobacter sp. GD03797]TGN24372.1 XRE family transcriptional regulator [Empedobacter tilapiae]